MRCLVKLCVFALLISPSLFAQDSIRISCPLNDAIVVPPPKNQIHYDPPDLCIVLTSIPDTTVKACTGARITTVTQNGDDESKWDIVMFRKYKNKEYYFWYIGLDKPIVRRFDTVKEGQAIGYIRSGEKMEMLMFDFETPVDPLRHMDCHRVLKGF
jgi:hypothetical protein